VRGLGLMVAIEFFNDAARREPAPELAKAVVAEAARRGLLLLSCGVYGNVIRIMTPLTIPDTVLDEGLCVLEDTVAAVSPVMA
jgi:4-aminobutyrate aminotransferase-like enzyme